MASTFRKIALQITIPVLAVLIAANAYVATRNLKRIHDTTNSRLEAAGVQADISNLVIDMDDMETGQGGYLLTGDPAYLQPYSDAKARLSGHFSRLRSRLAAKPRERSLEAQLESVAQSKIAEMEETVRLREQGYRHRSFVLVNSNRGKELMDEARGILNALSSAQAGDVSRYDAELKENVRRAYKETILTNWILLVVSVMTLLAFNMYSRRLERRCARVSEELQSTSTQLERFTSTMSRDFRALVERTRNYAKALIEHYGGFLPRQGQEQAQSIEDGTVEMNRLLDELFEEPLPIEDAPGENSRSETCVELIEIRQEKMSA